MATTSKNSVIIIEEYDENDVSLEEIRKIDREIEANEVRFFKNNPRLFGKLYNH